LVRFVGGPHDGLEIDYPTIARCCPPRAFDCDEGPVVFLLMPTSVVLLDQLLEGEIVAGDLDELIPYLQVNTAAGIEFHHDPDGRAFAEATQSLTPADQTLAYDGMYFKCLRGDNEHLALAEHDSFAVQDTRGRNWVCYPIPWRKVENLTMVAHLSEVFKTDDVSRRLGLGDAGTEVRIYFCKDESELRELLAEDPPVRS
jgi:hypothetical protein